MSGVLWALGVWVGATLLGSLLGLFIVRWLRKSR